MKMIIIIIIIVIIINYLQEQLRIFNHYLQCSEKLDSVGKHIQSSRAAELKRMVGSKTKS